MNIKLSQSDWMRIGRQMGWTKAAGGGVDIPLTGAAVAALKKAISSSAFVDPWAVEVKDEPYFISKDGEAQLSSVYHIDGNEEFKTWKAPDPDGSLAARAEAGEFVELIREMTGGKMAENRSEMDRFREDERQKATQRVQNRG